MSQIPESEANVNPVFLKRFAVENLKSLRTAQVDFYPLTLLVGQNSVGKSTVFQGLLSLVQWLDSGSTTNFPLNGEFTRLGSFAEAITHSQPRNFGSREISFSLDWRGGNLDLAVREESKQLEPSVCKFRFQSEDGAIEVVKHVDACLIRQRYSGQYIDADYGDGFGPSIYFGELTTRNVQTNATSVLNSLLDLPKAKLEAIYGLEHILESMLRKIAVIMVRASQHYDLQPNLIAPAEFLSRQIDEFRQNVLAKYADTSPMEAFLFLHLEQLTNRLLARIGVDAMGRSAQRELFKLLEVSNGEVSKKLVGSDFFKNFEFPDLRLTSEILEREDLEFDFELDPEIIEELVKVIEDRFEESGSFELDLSNSEIWWYQKSVVEAKESDGQYEYSYEPIEIKTPVDVLQENMHAYRDTFLSKLSYLGPLRVDGFHNALMGSVRNSTYPVGKSGELTSLLISENLKSQELRDFPVFGRGIEKTTFIHALDSWLRLFTSTSAHLEVTNKAKNGLQIEVDSRTLDQYGTGASQVLPILALVLSRKPGDVVLIEQPELHLHPGGQQYLADFFMMSASSGIQIALETHSEYIVNRIRRGAVLGKFNKEDVSIVNFEQSADGTAELTNVLLTGDGGFADWPQGFFAQTEEDLLDIIEALESREDT